MADDDRPVEIMSEPDPDQPGVWRGTGPAPPMAANMMMRLMAGRPSGARIEWRDEGRDVRLFNAADEQVSPRDDG